MSERVVLVYPDAREWLHIVQSISVLVEEASFSIKPDGISLRALDPSRTSMVDLFIPREAFDEYADIAEEVKVGANFKDMIKILRRAKKGDRLSLEVVEGRIRVKLVGKSVRAVAIPSIEVLAEELPTPRVVFTAMLKTASDVIAEAFKDADAVADAVKLEALEDAFYIRASSDKGELEVKIERGGEVVYEYEIKEPASALYSLEYLVDIASKASRVSDIVTVELATAKPVALSFDIPAGGRLTYYVAPRVE